MTPPIVTRYLQAAQRHRWAGIVGFTAITGIAGFVAIQPPPPVFFTAQGTLVYVSPPLTFSSTAASIQQQAQAVTGTGLVSEEVLTFVSRALEAEGKSIVPRKLKSGVNAKVTTGAALQVDVTYQADTKEEADRVTALFLEALVEQSRVFNTIQLTRIKDNLNELLPQVEAEVRQAEADLENYIRTEAPLLASSQDGSLINAIAASQANQRDLELSLAGLDTQITTLEARLGLTPDEAYASSALSSDPIIASLRARIYETESQLAILSQRFRSEHPQIVELLSQQQAYEGLLYQRVEEVIGGYEGAEPLQSIQQIRRDSSLDPARQQLANQLVALQSDREHKKQLMVTQRQLETQLRNEYSQLPNKQIQQAELTRNIALKQTFYNEIQARLADVTLAEKETVGNLVVAQEPKVTSSAEEPSSPVVVVIIGSVIGLVVGGALIFLLDSADPTLRMFSDIQKLLREQEVAILGLLPHLPLDDLRPQDMPVITSVDSPYVELFERFRSNLQRSTGKKPPKTILVTSTLPNEGKTFVSYNLAIASARAGKRTLLIEGDLRTPSQSHCLNAEPDAEQTIDPMRYYDPNQNSIRLVPVVENLYILPHPGIQRQAAAILESSELRRTLDDAKGRFDVVILDSPCLSRANDALLLEPYSDGMLLVTRPGHTEEGLLMDAIEQFIESETSTVTVLGAVINDADLDVPTAIANEDDKDPDILTIENLVSEPNDWASDANVLDDFEELDNGVPEPEDAGSESEDLMVESEKRGSQARENLQSGDVHSFTGKA